MSTTHSDLQLTREPVLIQWPPTHYVFVEARGSIPDNAPRAWHELLQHVPAIMEHNSITLRLSLYDMDAQLYRAGLAIDSAPPQLPAGVRYEHFGGGNYAGVTLTGSYAQLPQATKEAIRIMRASSFRLRPGFNIESYVNDPRTTPEGQLRTEILFPVE